MSFKASPRDTPSYLHDQYGHYYDTVLLDSLEKHLGRNEAIKILDICVETNHEEGKVMELGKRTDRMRQFQDFVGCYLMPLWQPGPHEAFLDEARTFLSQPGLTESEKRAEEIRAQGVDKEAEKIFIKNQHLHFNAMIAYYLDKIYSSTHKDKMVQFIKKELPLSINRDMSPFYINTPKACHPKATILLVLHQAMEHATGRGSVNHMESMAITFSTWIFAKVTTRPVELVKLNLDVLTMGLYGSKLRAMFEQSGLF